MRTVVRWRQPCKAQAQESCLIVAEMSEWVAVCADEAEEPVEIPTEADGESLVPFAISTPLFKFLLLLFRLYAAHISHRPVPGSNGVEIQESIYKHCQGCQDAGRGI